MLEKGIVHTDKEKLYDYLGFTPVNFANDKAPMQLKLIKYTEFVKERNKRFQVYQDNSKKSFLLWTMLVGMGRRTASMSMSKN